MKNTTFTIAFVLLILFGHTTIHAQTIISLTAKGEVEVVPDIATTTIYIEKTNKNAEKLQREVLLISKNIQQKLRKQKIAPKDIQTNSLKIEKEYEWKNNTKIFKGYKAYITTKVTFRDIAGLEKIYAQLLSNEEINLRGIQYDYSKKNAIENKAYLKALNNANLLATQLTKAAGFSTQKIKSISNHGYTPPAPIYMQTKSMKLSEVAMDNAPSVTINTGTIKVVKTLTIVYHLN